VRLSDQKLQRLLDAAAKATPEAVDPAPLGLEARVLGQWQTTPVEDEAVLLYAYFRHAALGAAVVLVLIAGWSLTQPRGEDNADEAAIGSYEIQVGLTP
jgi:hypothetical protein